MPGTANDLNISEPGYVTFDGTSVFHGRTLQAGPGITITNPTGITGNTTISANNSIDLHVARYIVAADGTVGTGANYTTIASAISAAQSSGVNSTIFIQPGTYTENFTITPGINLTAFECDSFTPNVTIIGKITMTAAGTCSLSGIRLQTNSDFLLSVTGNAASVINLINCFLNFSNSSGIQLSSSSASSSISLFNCIGNLGTTGIKIFEHTGSGSIGFNSCFFVNSGSSLTASTCTTGVVNSSYTNFNSSITFSGTASGLFNFSRVDTSNLNIIAFTAGGSGVQQFFNCQFSSGTSSAISISTSANIIACDIISSNAATIAGAGTINFSQIDFQGTSSTISTTTQVPFVTSNDAIKIVTPGAYPYTTNAQDAFIKVDSSSARTIIPLASPVTGQRHIIKDTAGLAGTNNITVTPSGKNIDGGASFAINTNYGSITIVYNGVDWSII